MANKKPHLIELLTRLLDKNVEFIICGGLASVYHGVERMTMDLDISLNFEKQNVQRFIDAMKTLKMKPRVPERPESLLDKERIEFFIKEKNALVFTFIDPDIPFKQIDVFLTKENSYQSIISDTIEINIMNKTTRIVSIKKLIEMKESIEPIREKDKFDIVELKKRLS